MWEPSDHKKCRRLFCEFVPRYEEVMVEIHPILARLPSPKPLILVSETEHRFDYEYGATIGYEKF